MHIAAGAVVEEVLVERVGAVDVSYCRHPDGWSATFCVRAGDAGDLGVEHCLVAPSLAEARRAVPSAVAYLAGEPID